MQVCRSIYVILIQILIVVVVIIFGRLSHLAQLLSALLNGAETLDWLGAVRVLAAGLAVRVLLDSCEGTVLRDLQYHHHLLPATT